MLSAWPKSGSWWHCCSLRRSTLAGSSALSAWKSTLSAICACKWGLCRGRGGEPDIARHVLVCWYDGVHFDATRQTTLCTFHRHDYGSFQQFLGSSDFFADNIPAVRKKCVPLPILSICFVTKTKITIWAESICGISPFLFFSKVLLDSDNLFFRTATNTTLDNF